MVGSAAHKATRLPELVGYITSFLRDDQKALLVCSLTCSAWHAIARPHTFCSITLNSESKLLQLDDLLNNVPVAGYWIHTLKIVGESECGWIPTFASVLSHRLHHLHTITFTKVHCSRLQFPVNWAATSGFARFKALHTLKFMERCHLKESQFRSFICTLPNLRNLHLDGVFVRENGKSEEDFVELYSPNLKKVSVGVLCDLAGNSFDTWLTNGGPLHQVRSLVLRVPDSGYSMDWHALNPHLESLVVCDSPCVHRSYPILSGLDVSSCTSLRQLALYDHRCDSGTLDLLQHLPSPRSLTQFIFSSHLCRRQPSAQRVAFRKLDDLLSSPTFSGLKHVHWIYRGTPERRHEDRISHRLAKYFPKLVAKDIMVIHFVPSTTEFPPKVDDLTGQLLVTPGPPIHEADETWIELESKKLEYLRDFILPLI